MFQSKCKSSDLMSLFGNSSVFGSNTAATTGFGTAAAGSGLSNPNKDYEIANPSDDSISSLAFSPATIQQNFLVSGAWDNNVRCGPFHLHFGYKPLKHDRLPYVSTVFFWTHKKGVPNFNVFWESQINPWYNTSA